MASAARATCTSVLFIRHTDVHNPEQIVYGRMPRFRLSDLGVAQAERTADRLASESIAAIYSSPQLRARQTAGIIADRHPGLNVRVSSRLAEMRSHWQGETFLIVDAINPYEPLKDPSDETMADIFRRMNAALRQVASRHPGGTTVCISHADPIAILRIGVLGRALTLENMRAENYPTKGSITRFDFTAESANPTVTYVDINGTFNTLPKKLAVGQLPVLAGARA